MAKELFIYTDITVYCNSSLSSLLLVASSFCLVWLGWVIRGFGFFQSMGCGSRLMDWRWVLCVYCLVLSVFAVGWVCADRLISSVGGSSMTSEDWFGWSQGGGCFFPGLREHHHCAFNPQPTFTYVGPLFNTGHFSIWGLPYLGGFVLLALLCLWSVILFLFGHQMLHLLLFFLAYVLFFACHFICFFLGWEHLPCPLTV